jgi:predicted nucleotidyltransferase/DNA-binding transcriptional ArsR family regulator
MRPPSASFLREPLSAVFSVPSGVRLLRRLCRHGGELSASQLVEQTGLTKPSVLSGLAHLVEQGLVDEIGSNRSRLFRARMAHPLAPALCDLFDAEDARYQDVLETARSAAGQAGAMAAWLYGSVARGQDRPGSDLDLAVVAAPERLASVKATFRDALRPAGDRLGFTSAVVGIDGDDILRLAADGDPWWRSLVRDAVPLTGPAPAALLARLRRDGAAA